MIPATPVRVRFAPARPVFSTSAVREPRSSTGSSHVTRAARSCSDRGHGRRALHRGDDPGDPRGSGVARHRLGRRAVYQSRHGDRHREAADAPRAGKRLCLLLLRGRAGGGAGGGDRAEGILRVQRAMSRDRRRRERTARGGRRAAHDPLRGSSGRDRLGGRRPRSHVVREPHDRRLHRRPVGRRRCTTSR